MTRLEKKCLAASASAHGALAFLLFLGPLIWVSRQPELARPVLNLIPTRLLDGVMAGGGSPLAKALPAPAPMAAAQRPLIIAAPPPPKPETAPAKPESKPARQETEPPAKNHKKTAEAVTPNKKLLAKADEPDDADGKPGKKKIQISLERESGSSKSKSNSSSPSSADARSQTESRVRAAQAQYAARLNQVLGAIGQGLSTGTAIDVPGPGGEAYADYGQWVVTVYYQAWLPPNVADESATVTAEVVILRNGTVESFRIIKRSGHGGLDKSVDLLRKVTFIERFPEGTHDERRTFIIDFIPRIKR
jgi:outer membrane biosynthesis protein TonB